MAVKRTRIAAIGTVAALGGLAAAALAAGSRPAPVNEAGVAPVEVRTEVINKTVRSRTGTALAFAPLTTGAAAGGVAARVGSSIPGRVPAVATRETVHATPVRRGRKAPTRLRRPAAPVRSAPTSSHPSTTPATSKPVRTESSGGEESTSAPVTTHSSGAGEPTTGGPVTTGSSGSGTTGGPVTTGSSGSGSESGEDHEDHTEKPEKPEKPEDGH